MIDSLSQFCVAKLETYTKKVLILLIFFIHCVSDNCLICIDYERLAAIVSDSDSGVVMTPRLYYVYLTLIPLRWFLSIHR